MAEAIVEAKDLIVDYARGGLFSKERSQPVLRQVSITIARGEIVGIVGESGSGKTTLGRVLLGLIAPRSGSIMFDGKSITDGVSQRARSLRRRMQMIFQDPMSSLNPRHRVGRILAGPLLLHEIVDSVDEAGVRVAAMLEKVGLPGEFARRYPHELSGGQRQRLGIARAVLLEPDFILADEIISGLDVSTQAQVLNIIALLQRELGLAMAFISHDLSVIRMICDRVVVLRSGVIVEEGSCDSVFANPRSAYTRSLIEAVPRPVYDPHFLAL